MSYDWPKIYPNNSPIAKNRSFCLFIISHQSRNNNRADFLSDVGQFTPRLYFPNKHTDKSLDKNILRVKSGQQKPVLIELGSH